MDRLSPDELRKTLFQTFKDKGVCDKLTAQFRNQFIQDFKHQLFTGAESVLRAAPAKFEPTMVSVCNSIAAEHLRVCGYEYTLSVFYPESGQCKDKVFTNGELLHLLKISPESVLYKSLSNAIKEDKGFLISLLTQLTHHHALTMYHDADTQTPTTSSYGESLVEKMKLIDKEYENFSYSGDRWTSVESRLAAYRKEIEAQMQAEMKTKMQHFKDVEVAMVQMEENTKFHKQFEKLKQELERSYEMKAEALMDREKNANDRLQKQQEIEEKNQYIQRQSLLKEIDTLRNRENELKMRMEAFEKTCQIHEEKVKTTEELLRRRELAVKTMEGTHDQTVKNKLLRYQLELKEEFMKRTEKLIEDETRIKVETARIQKESALIESKLEEHNRVCSELKRLQVELNTAQQQVLLLNQQKEMMKERLETMSDYPSLKREKTELEGKLHVLKNELEQAQEEAFLLRGDLNKPSKEQLALQLELQKLQNDRRLDEEEHNNQKQVLVAQLQSEVEQSAQLKAQLIECKEKLQWMTDYAKDIKMQYSQTQKALENEVLLNPSTSSGLDWSAEKLVHPDIYGERAVLRARLENVDVCAAGDSVRPPKYLRTDIPDSDTDSVAEAKTRLDELQEEAELLNEAYRKYQQRAVQSTISHFLPAKPSITLHHQFAPLKNHISHRSHIHSTHQSKFSHTPQSPQPTRSPSPAHYDTKNAVQPRHLDVTSGDHDEPHSTVSTDGILHLLPKPLPQKTRNLQDGSSSPSDNLSAKLLSTSRTNLQGEISEEVSSVVLPQLSPDRQSPCVPPEETLHSCVRSPELSPPQSPQRKSTARDQASPPQPQTKDSILESSPQLEKISIEDLSGISSEPSHIPEPLLDTAVPLTEEAPVHPAAPQPPDLPEDTVNLQGQADAPEASGEAAHGNDEEGEIQRFLRERKEREEKRLRDQEEARERELEELKRLEAEMLLQEVEEPAQEEEEPEISKCGDEEQNQETRHEDKESKSELPLEKYMKIVLEKRKNQQAQSPVKERGSSPEAQDLFEEQDYSIETYSDKAKEEDDDDFW